METVEYTHIRVCMVCGDDFAPKTINHTYCSTSCVNKARRMRRNGTLPLDTERTANCPICGVEFTTSQPFKVCCCNRHAQQYYRQNNPQAVKAKDRRKVRKTTIGLHIRDEVIGPRKAAENYWLWDGNGLWTMKYWPEITACKLCKTTVYRHYGQGVCHKCADALKKYTDDPEVRKKYARDWYVRAKAQGYQSSDKVARGWINKARNREIQITPTINNLLKNLQKA